MDTRYCAVCNKEIVKMTFDGWVYKKMLGNNPLYACSWTCFNKIKIPNKKSVIDKERLEKELSGKVNWYKERAQRPLKERQELAKESKEVAEKRKEIERGLKKRNKLGVYWHRDNPAHSNNQTEENDTRNG